MDNQNIKNKIKQVAVDMFDKHGYHGTTIRNISKEVNCSLPMVYYYYENKQMLFHEIIKNDYFELLKRQYQRLNTEDILEFYTQYVSNLNDLSEHDRKIYRLGIKVYLLFDGDEDIQKVMAEWEKSIIPRHYNILLPHLKDRKDAQIIVKTLIHVIENMIERIVVKNIKMTKEEIKEELNIILKIK